MKKVDSYLIEAHILRLINDRIEFLLLKRAEGKIYPGIWQMVTGTIKNNEKAFNTALREIKEETELTPEKLWIVSTINSFYSPKSDSICMVPVFVSLVNANEIIKISNEHSEYKWVNKDQAIKMLAWKGQRDSVDLIHNYFSNADSNLKFEEILLIDNIK